MFHLKPLNGAAEDAMAQQKAFLNSRLGLVVQSGRQTCWLGRLPRSVKRASEGEVINPNGTRRMVVGFDGNAALSDVEVRDLMNNPQSGTFPVFEVTPKSGRFLLRVSQIAFGLGLLYLATGVALGVVTPTALHYVSLFYGGGQLPSTNGKMKDVIHDFAVAKEAVFDERTKKFFDAIQAVKSKTSKEQAK